MHRHRTPRYFFFAFLIFFSCSLYARKDSTLHSAQYVKAINHIKHDTTLLHKYNGKEYRFLFDNHVKAGGSMGYFLPEYISYVYKKPYGDVDKKIVDSTYSLFSKNNSDSTNTISCLRSDRKPLFKLRFVRENDTIICIVVSRYEKQHHGFFHKKKPDTAPEPTFGIAYLFIFDKKNNIETVFKSLFI